MDCFPCFVKVLYAFYVLRISVVPNLEHLLFPFIFNLADAAISVGVTSILIWHRKYFKGEPKVQTESIEDSNPIALEEE